MLRHGFLYQNTESTIIFTCGGSDSISNPTGRQKILRYAERQFPEFNFFRAEDTFSAIDLPAGEDLLTAEIRLLQYSDCILIILESPGAIAELGAFSVDDIVASKILLINNEMYKDEQSFLQKGPVAKIERISDFKPVIHAKFNEILRCAPAIRERLERIQRKRRSKSILGHDIHKLKLDSRIRILLLLDVISIYSPLTGQEVKYLAREIFKESEVSDLDLAVLKGLGYISIDGDYYVRKTKSPQYFFSLYNAKFDQLRSRVLLHYFRKSTDRIRLMGRHCNV